MKKNNRKGFTLVELAIVVAVMAILVAIAIPAVSSITGTAKKNVYDSNCQTIESMIKLAEADASKNGDGVVALTADQIYTALTDAKLGLDSDDGPFYYHPDTGTVDNNSDDSNKTDSLPVVTINFKDGVAKS